MVRRTISQHKKRLAEMTSECNRLALDVEQKEKMQSNLRRSIFKLSCQIEKAQMLKKESFDDENLSNAKKEFKK
jgi:hypothetical protein